MPCRQQAPPPGGGVDQPIGVGERGRERLFHEHRASLLDERHRHLDVRVGRNGHRDCIDHRANVRGACECPGCVFRGNFLGATRLGIHHADELDVLHVREQASVMLAEVADADDSDTKSWH